MVAWVGEGYAKPLTFGYFATAELSPFKITASVVLTKELLRMSIADVAVGSIFVNYRHGKGEVDAKRWPKLADYVERVHARPSFKGLIEEDQRGIQSLGG